LLAVSPRGEVPALVDGDAVVYDSTLICEYLEERHPTPALLPSDAAGRVRVRALERWADMQLDGQQGRLPSLPARAAGPSRRNETLRRSGSAVLGESH
jgi:glutathione S-transferase